MLGTVDGVADRIKPVAGIRLDGECCSLLAVKPPLPGHLVPDDEVLGTGLGALLDHEAATGETFLCELVAVVRHTAIIDEGHRRFGFSGAIVPCDKPNKLLSNQIPQCSRDINALAVGRHSKRVVLLAVEKRPFTGV